MAKKKNSMNMDRRSFLRLLAGTSALGLSGVGAITAVQAKSVVTNARIVIVGAGAAGISLANRLTRETEGAHITIIDRTSRHVYQPGLTLVATGSWKAGKVIDVNSAYMPRSVKWLQEMVAEYLPSQNIVVTDQGTRVPYDYLVIATGLHVDFDAIEGMSTDLIGQQGIGCVYDSPEHAQRTWNALAHFAKTGGKAVYTRGPGGIKCAGAPLKVAMLSEHYFRREKVRDNIEMVYNSPSAGLFSQPDINSFLKEHFPERGIHLSWHRRLVGIEPERKVATFATPDGTEQQEYDFLHVVPPMRAPDSLGQSDLAWQEGSFAVDGHWLEVDRHSMRHRRYSNVFGAGDCIGTPIGKTAASVKAQVPVVVRNLLRVLEGKEPDAMYNGYTSCPLVLEEGQAILVEFDYDLNMVPSFGFINPLKAGWVPWLMKDYMLQGAYNAMLRGRI